MQIYSDPSRADDPWTLPNVEVVHRDESENTSDTVFFNEDDQQPYGTGWYWWTCLPGCMPDSSPFGPYPTEAAAIAAAQDIH